MRSLVVLQTKQWSRSLSLLLDAGMTSYDIIRIQRAKSKTLSIAAGDVFCSATKQLLKNGLTAWRQELLIYLDRLEHEVVAIIWTQIPLSGKHIHPSE